MNWAYQSEDEDEEYVDAYNSTEGKTKKKVSAKMKRAKALAQSKQGKVQIQSQMNTRMLMCSFCP